VEVNFDPPTDPAHFKDIVADGKHVGYVRKPKHGKGYFVGLDGITWNNAPGARYSADAGGGAPETYVTSLPAAKARVIPALKERMAHET
jgi:hypothetical protein